MEPKGGQARPQTDRSTGDAHVVVVTGRSGAGRSTAMATLEDCGYARIETPALEFVPDMLAQLVRDRATKIAVGVDARAAGGRDLSAAPFFKMLDVIRASQRFAAQIVFLDGSDEALRRRYTETRRRHPLSRGGGLDEGVALDRALAEPLRDAADLVIDTSHMAAADFRRMIRHRIAGQGAGELTISVVSFAYRNGLPEEADLVFDCRFLRNPHYDATLRPKTGRSPEVQSFIAGDPLFEPFIEQLIGHARLLLPAFAAEGKSYVTFAFGCTGGKHRSIAVAETFAHALTTQGWRPRLRHREHPTASASDRATTTAVLAPYAAPEVAP